MDEYSLGEILQIRIGPGFYEDLPAVAIAELHERGRGGTEDCYVAVGRAEVGCELPANCAQSFSGFLSLILTGCSHEELQEL